MPKIPINKTPMPKTAPAWWPHAAREICALADIPLNAARGFTLYGDNENVAIECLTCMEVVVDYDQGDDDE